MVGKRLILLAALACTPAWACTVSAVHDGDTLTVTCGDTRTTVRLMEIDAPETAQPHGPQSTRALARLCLGRHATMRPAGQDRYGRTLARVRCARHDASLYQAQWGHAWAFDRYLTDPAIKSAEASARHQRRGLWIHPSPTPPWEYRRNHRP